MTKQFQVIRIKQIVFIEQIKRRELIIIEFIRELLIIRSVIVKWVVHIKNSINFGQIIVIVEDVIESYTSKEVEHF